MDARFLTDEDIAALRFTSISEDDEDPIMAEIERRDTMSEKARQDYNEKIAHSEERRTTLKELGFTDDYISKKTS